MTQPPEHRRHQALDRYLANDKIEDICRQLACVKSWLYKWRKRYDATNPAWSQERSTRPQHSPTRTPDHIVRAIVSLYETLPHSGTGRGATAILRALAQHGLEPVPSRRTIYRILRHYHTEVKAHEARASTHC
jgi:transposase-like protein